MSREKSIRQSKVFVDLIDSMLKFQDESGMWYQLPALGGQEPNYLETSGSAIMAYSLLKGVRLGFLPESYRAYGLKAFQGEGWTFKPRRYLPRGRTGT